VTNAAVGKERNPIGERAVDRTMPATMWMKPFVLCAIATFTLTAPSSATPTVSAQTRIFLDAYARGDRATVLHLIDGDAVTIYGSDAGEIFRGRAGVARMLDYDHRLWGRAARIGPMDHVSVIERGEFASIFFDAPFTLPGRPRIPVRFAMVWQREAGEWRLVQSSNVVPTEDRSAALLLHRQGRRP
jgi:ketosteroid isomerase-like protein